MDKGDNITSFPFHSTQLMVKRTTYQGRRVAATLFNN